MWGVWSVWGVWSAVERGGEMMMIQLLTQNNVRSWMTATHSLVLQVEKAED